MQGSERTRNAGPRTTPSRPKPRKTAPLRVTAGRVPRPPPACRAGQSAAVSSNEPLRWADSPLLHQTARRSLKDGLRGVWGITLPDPAEAIQRGARSAPTGQITGSHP